MTAPPQWRRQINKLLNQGGLQMVFQPIWELATEKVEGYEALARFPEIEGVYYPPDVWFAEAQRAGLGPEMEMMAVGCAIEAIPHVSPCYVSVNVGAATILWPRFAEVVLASFPDHVVVELTEHDAIDSYEPLLDVLTALRGRSDLRIGVSSTDSRLARLAIDDVGAGHSGLARIVRLLPDILKMDRSLVTDIDTNTTLAALAAGMVIFAAQARMTLVAEGIETVAERDALMTLGVTHGQGFLLGRPHRIEEVGPCEGMA